jgi:hypothetical protein
LGKTTAGLPLQPGQHYERCPSCATVYRSKRRNRFRCPGCHRLTYAVPTPAGEDGNRRTIEGDPAGRVYRVLDRRRQEGEATPDHGEDVVLFLEEPDAEPPAPDAPPSPDPGPGPRAKPTPTARKAAAARQAAPTSTLRRRLGRVWRGSLGDLLHREPPK